MKIKELHIRNIASIVSFDIDFEKESGLLDPDTGKPAQKFLIYGPTGSGKSMLLDAISLALFGKTPRLKDVKDQKENKYKSNGVELNVNSITQYRRIGIGDKEESYSEVVFDDNDGVECRARIEFTTSRSRGSDSATEYKKKREAKIGSNDWITRDKEADAVLLEHTGMDFDQYSRLAMLAQGAFSRLLEGKREERSALLEKLTKTEIFSTYGKTISEIYNKYKSAYTLKEEAYKREQGKLEEVNEETLKAELESTRTVQAEAKKEKETLAAKIAEIEKIEELGKKLEEADKKLQGLNEIKESADYKTKEENLKVWDSTEAVRKSVADKEQAEKSVAEACKLRKQQKKEFFVLAADLKWKEQKNQELSDEVSRLEEWLEGNKDRQSLYEGASATIEKMKNYANQESSLTSKKSDQGKASGASERLKQKVEEAKIAKEEAEKKQSVAQQEIDNLKRQYDAIGVEKLDEERGRITKSAQAYEKLASDYGQHKKNVKEIDDLEKEIKKTEELLSKQKDELAQKQQGYDKSKKAYDEANAKFTTANASLDETLEAIRSQLKEGETCPLCGSKVERLLSREQFAEIVSPLKEERERLWKDAEEKMKTLDATKKVVGKTEGQLEVQRNQESKKKEELKQEKEGLRVRLEKAEIAEGEDVESVIEKRCAEIEKRNGEIAKLKQDAADLLKQRNEKENTKKPLDAAVQEKSTAWQNAENEEKGNRETIERLTKEIAEIKEKQEKEKKEISAIVGGVFPKWWEDIANTMTDLRQQAEEYLGKKKEYEKKNSRLEQAKSLVNNIRKMWDKIVGDNADWGAIEVEAQELREGDTVTRWNGLTSACGAAIYRMSSGKNEIEKSQQVIDEWMAETGKDEEYIKQLIALRDSIDNIRREINEVTTAIATNISLRNRSTEEIGLSRAKLGLQEGESLPDKEELKEQRAAAEQRESDATVNIGALTTKLQAVADNRAEAEKLHKEMQEAEKIKEHWKKLNDIFGGDRFRNLVQTHILRPLLDNANMYLKYITDRYELVCDDMNEQLGIFVIDHYNRGERSNSLLSGGEKFMVSLALSLALSSLNARELKVNILFIDEGFGTLSPECLTSVMNTLDRLSTIPGQTDRRVGIISHRSELLEWVPNKIRLTTERGQSSISVAYDD